MNNQATARIAILNVMGDADFARSLERQASWGITDLDLKDSIFGKGVVDLSDEEAFSAAGMICDRGMQTCCLSTVLFHDDPVKGEQRFKEDNLDKVPRIIEVAKILKPRFIRLLPARVPNRDKVVDSIAWAHATAPWLMGMYRTAISMIRDAGFEPTVENEVHGCMFGSPAEIAGFFREIGPGASFTWDIQNLWESGTFPSLDTYHLLKPWISYVHVKGGIADPATQALAWASPLSEASWPVAEIVRAVLRDRISPVICINPSHGARRPGYDGAKAVETDISFLKSIIKGENA